MHKKFLLLAISVLLASAFSVSVFAIGFDAEEKYNAIFVIYSGNSLGSGFAIGENCIISNAHVIGDQNNIKLTSYDRKNYTAHILAFDKAKDIAVLQVDQASFPYLTVADDQKTKIGSDVYAIGAPDSMTYTLTKGILSAKNRTIGSNQYLQLDAPVNSGNSGGPLLNESGEVIGVNTLKLGNTEGIGLAIPMTTVRNFLKSSGIKLNESGNIVGKVTSDVASTSERKKTDTRNDPSTTTSKGSARQTLILALIGAGLVLLILLFVFLTLKKNRTIKPKLDKSDRTDFDIDILE
jgi:Trypsin-like serine proteases, typically periplasmic, contain C-terminal PDZ domain